MSEDNDDDLLRELNDQIGGLIDLDGVSYVNGSEELQQQNVDETSTMYKFNLFSQQGYQDIALDRQVLVGDDKEAVDRVDETVYVIAERPMSYYFTSYIHEMLVECCL